MKEQERTRCSALLSQADQHCLSFFLIYLIIDEHQNTADLQPIVTLTTENYRMVSYTRSRHPNRSTVFHGSQLPEKQRQQQHVTSYIRYIIF